MLKIKIRKKREKYQIVVNEEVVCNLSFIEDCYEVRLFYLGIKKSTSQNFKKENIPVKMMKNFPHDYVEINENYVNIRFFQNSDIEEEYKIKKENKDKELWFKYLGNLFGYPPIATDDFMDRKEENDTGIFKYNWKQINFHGIRFICKEENIEKCLEWLHLTYEIPTTYQSGIKIRNAFENECVRI